MSVDELNPGTAADAELASVHELLAGVHAEASTAEPYRSESETLRYLRHPPQSERRFHWIVRDRGEAVGFAQLAVDRPAAAGRLIELAVHPRHRRHGLGGELLDAARRCALAAGCRVMAGRHATAAGAAFAAGHGATDARRDVRSMLSMDDFAASVPDVAGYHLVCWKRAAPDALVESYAHARTAINDAPSTSGEWEAWDVARVRDMERITALRDRELRVTVAVGATGEVAGFTELRVARTAGAVASTEDTAVVREHRGRGLAMWMKCRSLSELRRDRPDVRLVTTSNAESNAAIRLINTRLGFVPVAVQTVWLLELTEG